MTMRILHFADAHIDMANHGRHDPESGLPVRILDFLKSLDIIVETAISEKVDMVIFAGDAYRDRTPSPTFQREWGKRIMSLSKAGIPTLLLIGNHDISPAQGRAHAIQEFDTLEVPNIRVLAKPCFLTSEQLGLPLQVIALPWLSRSEFLATWDLSGDDAINVHANMEERLTERVKEWLSQADPDLPIILTAHASVQGAKYGAERTVMLGSDLVLSGSLVKNPRLDYVALGHIHKAQNLNEGFHPPVIYPGSIERVDFGEAQDDKYFVIAEIERGKTIVDWRKLDQIRSFIDCSVELKSEENVTSTLENALPSKNKIKDAYLRLTITYPREWESLIDDQTIRSYAADAFEFHIIRRPQIETRIRLPEDQTVSSLSPLELLDIYWKAGHVDENEQEALNKLAMEILTNNTESNSE
ncbi:MAG: exonuclease SbcCD subunit D [Chloroflexota bacterium]